MFISKHHYAIELAKRGNIVYFLNPPEVKKGNNYFIRIKKSSEQENLLLIEHSLFFPFFLKFHMIGLFHLFMWFHVKKILKIIDRKIDIVWSFDLGNIYPLNYFSNKSFKIFHPVDEPLNKAAFNSGKGADILFSVTDEIIEKYKFYKIPGYFINHGISNRFLNLKNTGKALGNVRVGFSGNLLRSDIDRETFIQIIQENLNLIFECWGNYDLKEANIGGNEDKDSLRFIYELKTAPNVILHGVVPSNNLPKEFNRMDAFLICYDIMKDQSKGTNYHKVMEFISIGRVIIANNITTYKNKPELVQMVKERDNNSKLPELFRNVINNLSAYNSNELKEARTNFAICNTYEKQIDRIEFLISQTPQSVAIID